MKQTLITTLFLSTLSLTTPNIFAQQLENNLISDNIYIIHNNTKNTIKGSKDNFTGDVTVSPLITAKDPLKKSAGYVTFQAGGRTNWHIHPNGQMLIGISGIGQVQQWNGATIEIHAGDVVWIPAGVKHWHGATPDDAFTHFALADIVDGKSSKWLEKVTDEQYQSKKHQ